MKTSRKRRPIFLHIHREPVTHWKDSEEMHRVMHTLEGPVRALLLELLEQPLSRDELQAALLDMGSRMGRGDARRVKRIDLDAELAQAFELGVLEECDGKYRLTPGGREMAEHMQVMIPRFFATLLSEKVVSFTTVAIHVLLSVLKVACGLLAHSAGLLADGIDNTADTLSAGLVWLGISLKKERLVAIFIVVMMFVSVGGVALTSYHKLLHPQPVNGGVLALVLSLGCGALMAGLSAYQYLTGKRHANFALLCQAVDSRNHVWTSLLVCGGIGCSLLAEALQTSVLYYADAAASLIIGFLILRSAVELAGELVKSNEELTDISHFVRSAQERMRTRVIFTWLTDQLRDTPLTAEQLEERFIRQFCTQTPKILTLTGMGYCPENSRDLHRHLEQFVKEKKLFVTTGTYSLQ